MSLSYLYSVSQIHFRKVDQLAVEGNGTVYGYCMSVAISWSNEMEYNL